MKRFPLLQTLPLLLAVVSLSSGLEILPPGRYRVLVFDKLKRKNCDSAKVSFATSPDEKVRYLRESVFEEPTSKHFSGQFIDLTTDEDGKLAIEGAKFLPQLEANAPVQMHIFPLYEERLVHLSGQSAEGDLSVQKSLLQWSSAKASPLLEQHAVKLSNQVDRRGVQNYHRENKRHFGRGAFWHREASDVNAYVKWLANGGEGFTHPAELFFAEAYLVRKLLKECDHGQNVYREEEELYSALTDASLAGVVRRYAQTKSARFGEKLRQCLHSRATQLFEKAKQEQLRESEHEMLQAFVLQNLAGAEFKTAFVEWTRRARDSCAQDGALIIDADLRLLSIGKGGKDNKKSIRDCGKKQSELRILRSVRQKCEEGNGAVWNEKELPVGQQLIGNGGEEAAKMGLCLAEMANKAIEKIKVGRLSLEEQNVIRAHARVDAQAGTRAQQQFAVWADEAIQLCASEKSLLTILSMDLASLYALIQPKRTELGKCANRQSELAAVVQINDKCRQNRSINTNDLSVMLGYLPHGSNATWKQTLGKCAVEGFSKKVSRVYGLGYFELRPLDAEDVALIGDYLTKVGDIFADETALGLIGVVDQLAEDIDHAFCSRYSVEINQSHKKFIRAYTRKDYAWGNEELQRKLTKCVEQHKQQKEEKRRKEEEEQRRRRQNAASSSSSGGDGMLGVPFIFWAGAAK